MDNNRNHGNKNDCSSCFDMKVVNALISFEKRDTRFTFGLTCDNDDNDEYDYNNYINSKDNIIRSLRIEFIR